MPEGCSGGISSASRPCPALSPAKKDYGSRKSKSNPDHTRIQHLLAVHHAAFVTDTIPKEHCCQLSTKSAATCRYVKYCNPAKACNNAIPKFDVPAEGKALVSVAWQLHLHLQQHLCVLLNTIRPATWLIKGHTQIRLHTNARLSGGRAHHLTASTVAARLHVVIKQLVVSLSMCKHMNT